MNVKKWLNRGWRLDREINSLRREKERAFADATNTAPVLSDIKVQASKMNTTEQKLINYAEYSRLIDKRLDELYQVKSEILRAIARVEDGTLRTLLTERFIEFKTWEKIAEDIGVETRHVYRLAEKALKAIERQ